MAGCAGTLLTAHLALEHGIACNTAGGTHHAQHAAGSGFCIINDLAITALSLPRVLPERVRRVLVLDLDVHQGDGTAQILRGAEPTVWTVSLHADRNFPARKQPSSLDVGLPDGVGDEEYLRCVSALHAVRCKYCACCALCVLCDVLHSLRYSCGELFMLCVLYML